MLETRPTTLYSYVASYIDIIAKRSEYLIITVIAGGNMITRIILILLMVLMASK